MTISLLPRERTDCRVESYRTGRRAASEKVVARPPSKAKPMLTDDGFGRVVLNRRLGTHGALAATRLMVRMRRTRAT